MSNIDNLAIASDSIMASAFANATKAKTKPTTSKHKPKAKGPRGFAKTVKVVDAPLQETPAATPARGFTKASLVSDSFPSDRIYNPNHVFDTNCRYTIAPNQKQLLVTIGSDHNIGEYKALFAEAITVKLLDGNTARLKLPLQPFILGRNGHYNTTLIIKRRVSETEKVDLQLTINAQPDGKLSMSGDLDCVESFELVIDDGSVGEPSTVKDDFDACMCRISALAKSVSLPNLTRPVVWTKLAIPHNLLFGKVATNNNDIEVIKEIVALWAPKYLWDVIQSHEGRYTTSEGDSITAIRSIVMCNRHSSALYHFTVNSIYRVSMFLKV